MKVLVSVCQPFFSFRGTSFSVYYRTKVMAEKGVEIDLLTYGDGEDVDLPGVNIIRIPKIPFLGPVKVGPSFKKAFLNVFVFIWMVGLLIKNRYDCIHAHEESAFFCLLLQKIFRFKWIYDMHSSLPQQLSNFKFTQSKLLIKLFRKLEKASLKSANAVITICPELQNHALTFIANPKKHFLIENSLFEPIGEKKNLEVNLPKDKKLIVYAGTFEQYQGIDLLLKAFQQVTRKEKDAFLMVIGGTGPQVKAYEEMVKKYQLGDLCKIYPRMEQSQVREIVGKAMLQVSPRTDGTNTPLKNYEQLANGIPLVATNISSHTQILDDKVCFLTEPKPESVANCLLLAIQNPKLCKQKVENAQKLYHQKYSRTVYEKKIDSLLELLNRSGKL